jgi:catechol-2,3-dioxygenase
MEPEAAVTGVSHLSISVSDLHRSLEFYRDVLKLPLLVEPSPGVGFEGHGAMLAVGRVGLGLQQHADHQPGRFDPRRTGLDHLAFQVAGREVLEDWQALLDESNCSHSGIQEIPGYGFNLHFHDPDGVQLELFAPLT